MNVQSETCTSESECASSVDKSSSEDTERKNKDSKSSASSIKGVLAIPTTIIIPWTYSEHGAFLHGLYIYGKDWKQIAAHVRSRNAEEVQRHFHSFQKEEPFVFTLRRMLDDFALDHIIAWLPGGQSFRIYNKLTCMRIAVLLYKGDSFNFDHFQKELCTHGFEQNAENGVWFHSDFCRNSSLELKQRDSKTNVCDYQFCKKTGNLMQCSGCRNVQYCCVACQQNDWRFHKWVCSKDMSGNDKPRRIDTSTSKQSHDKNVEVISKKSNQRKAKPITTSKSKIALKDDIKTNTGEWSVGEHCLFLEGLERYGRSWKNVASHVKTRTALQVNNHGRDHLKKIDCYWTTKEHLRFLEGLKRFGRGRWVEIATHVETKNNKQVAFHAKEYFKEEKMNGMSQKMDSSLEDSVGIIKKSERDWYWSAEEHNRFLEGLEQHGRSWKHVASHVKTRTYAQVNGYGYRYLNKIDCYWTTKEHQLFLEGLKQYGREHWEEIATHVGTKNNYQVAFHAKEHFKEEEIKEESQKTTDDSGEHSPVARMVVKKPNHCPIYASSRNAKRSIDQAGDSTSTSSKKSRAKESIKQKSDEQSIVTLEKDTALEGDMQNVTDSTKSVLQESNELRDESKLRLPPNTDSDMLNKGMWTDEEHRLFLEGLRLYGKGEWKKIASHIKTRTNLQVKAHAWKYFARMQFTTTERWADEEQHLFIEGLELYGKGEWKKISSHIRSRTWVQVRDHFTKTVQKTFESKLLQSEDMTSYNAHQNVEDITEKEEVINGKKRSVSDAIAAPDDIDDTSCPICLEKLNDPHIVPECCHRFCKGCIEEALEYRRECPICRGRVTSRRSLRRDEVFSKLLRLLDVERAKLNANIASTLTNTNTEQLSDNNVTIASHHTKDGEKKETTDTTEMTQEAYMKEKEENKIHVEEEQNVRNINIEMKSQDKAIEIQLQKDGEASGYLEAQLEEKNTKIQTLENLVQSLSTSVNDLKTQLRDKNDRIQFLESRQKIDEEHLQDDMKTSNLLLQTQLEEKDTKIKALEKLIRTLSNQSRIREMAAAVKDLQSQSQHKDDRIQYLESREKADKEKLQCLSQTSKHLETQLEEEKTRSDAFEKVARTLSDEHEIESMAVAVKDLQSQFQQKNARIQFLESRKEKDEEKLRQMTAVVSSLKKKLEEVNSESLNNGEK